MNILASPDNRNPGVQSPSRPPKAIARPSRDQAEQAMTTLIRWTGDDPKREGVIETPRVVIKRTTRARCLGRTQRAERQLMQEDQIDRSTGVAPWSVLIRSSPASLNPLSHRSSPFLSRSLRTSGFLNCSVWGR